jgi:hypothetical protein
MNGRPSLRANLVERETVRSMVEGAVPTPPPSALSQFPVATSCGVRED